MINPADPTTFILGAATSVSTSKTAVSFSISTAYVMFANLGQANIELFATTLGAKGSGFTSLGGGSNKIVQVPAGTTTVWAVSDSPSIIEYAIVTAVATGTAAASANLAQMLPRWRLALAKMRNGTKNAKILCIGDSTTAGVQGTYPINSHSWPTRLAQFLNRNYETTATGAFITGYGYTSQWTSYGTAQNGPFGPCGNSWQFSSTTGALVATPGYSWDTCDIYFLGNTNLGNFSAQATGGTLTTINGNAAQGQYKSTVSAASASSANTLTINGLSTSSSYLTIVEPYLSTQKQIIVGNIGCPGSTTQSWIDTYISNPAFGALPLLPLYQADLTLICLGINDENQSVPLATSMANLAALVAAVIAAGSDVILVTFPPSNGYNTGEAALVSAQLAFAQSMNIPVVDEYNRLGGVYQPAFMAGGGDLYHPNDYGYSDWAHFVGQALVTL